MKSRSACRRSARTCPQGFDSRPTAPRAARSPLCANAAGTQAIKKQRRRIQDGGRRGLFLLLRISLTSIPESVPAPATHASAGRKRRVIQFDGQWKQKKQGNCSDFLATLGGARI